MDRVEGVGHNGYCGPKMEKFWFFPNGPRCDECLSIDPDLPQGRYCGNYVGIGDNGICGPVSGP